MLFVSVSVDTAERDVKAFVSSGILVPQPGQHFSGLLTGDGVWKTRARVTPRADKALTPDIFYD